MSKKIHLLFTTFLEKYLILNQFTSNLVLKLFETKTGRLFITYCVLAQLSLLIGIVSIDISYIYISFITLVTLYLFFTTTKIADLFKIIFKNSPLNSFKLSLYCLLYSLYLIIAWFGLIFTSMGWAGILYIYAIPICFLFFLYTLIVSIIRIKKGYKFIEINKRLIFTTFAFQILLMIFNFRTPFNGDATAFMEFGNKVAIFIAPTYFILLMYFTLSTPLRNVIKQQF